MCKTTLFITRGKKNEFISETSGEKVSVSVSPFFFFFLGRSVESTPKLFVWLISSWTGSWQSAPYVWTIHNPSKELHNHSHPPSVWRVGDYTVHPILVSVWRCEVMSDAIQLLANPSPPNTRRPTRPLSPPPPASPSPPSLCPTPPLRNLHCD